METRIEIAGESTIEIRSEIDKAYSRITIGEETVHLLDDDIIRLINALTEHLQSHVHSQDPRYIIVKSSRLSGLARWRDAYSGPACDVAGVVPGKLYADLEVALREAEELSKHNPVGFIVVQVGTDMVFFN